MSDENDNVGVLLHPPREGFSKGQWQGLGAFAVLLAIILAMVLLGHAAPGTGSARIVDFLVGAAAAILCVWVVGGMVELNWTLLDVGIKATGGAAVVIAVFLWFQPVYGSGSDVRWTVSVELPPNTGLGFLLDQIEAENRAGRTDLVVKLQSNDVRSFRPRPADQALEYVGTSWSDVLAKVDLQSACITADQSDNTITLSIDEEKTVEVGDGPMLMCS